MLARTATRAASRLASQQRRTLMGLDVKSDVAAKRALQNAGGTWQGAANPTYLKQGSDKAVAAVGAVLMAAASFQLIGGCECYICPFVSEYPPANPCKTHAPLDPHLPIPPDWNMMHGTGKK